MTNSKALASSTFGSSYQELRNIYDLSKNNIRDLRLGYALRPLGAIDVEGITKNYTMDHGFELILTDTTTRNESDAQKELAFNTMFERGHEFFTALVNTKISLPSSVLNVFAPTFFEPETLPESKGLVLRLQYTVKYRVAL